MELAHKPAVVADHIDIVSSTSRLPRLRDHLYQFAVFE
jgi:hypothetical protein